MSKRTLGSLIVQLGVELGQYRADWKQAEQATRQGAAAVDQATGQAARSTGELTDALKEQTGAFGDAAEGAGEFARSAGLLNAASIVALGSLAALAAGIGAVGYAAYKGYRDNQQLQDSLLLTGNYAGLVAGQLDAMAERVSSRINGTVAASRQVLAQLTSTGRFTVESMEETAAAVQLVAKFSGKSSADVVKDFAAMGDGVAKWAERANGSYHFLDSATLAYIKRLEEQGLKQEAARLTSEKLSEHLGGDLLRNMGTIERAWHDIAKAASDAWEAMKRVGRPDTAQEVLADSSEYLYQAMTGLRRVSAGELQELKTKNLELQKRSEWEQRSAADRSATAQATERANAADKEWEKIVAGLATKQERLNSALERARRVAAVRNTPPAELAEVEARIQAEYATKPRAVRSERLERDPYDALLRRAQESAATMQLEAAGTEKLTQAERARANYMADLSAGYIVYNAQKDRSYLATLAEWDATEKSVRADALVTKENEAAARALGQRAEASRKSAASIAEQTERDRVHIATLGLTGEALGEVQAARLEDAAAALERRAVVARDIELSGEWSEALLAEAAALREAAQAKRDRGQADALHAATKAAAKVAEEEARATREAWQRTGDFIVNTLSDSLQRGFEAGKRFSRAFMDSLAATAKTTVIRFGVQFVGQAFGFGTGAGASNAATVAGAGQSALNLLGGANALSSFTGGGSLLGLFGTAGNAALGTSMGLGAGSAAAAAEAAAIAGGANAASAGALASLGSTVMSAVPYIGAALAVAGALGLFDKKGGPKVEGGFNVAGMQRGDVAGAKAMADDYNSTFASLATSFGLRDTALGAGVFFAKDPAGDSLTQYEVQAAGYSRAARMGGFENVGRDDASLAAVVAEEKIRALWQGLKVRAEQLTPALRALLDAAGNTQDVAAMQATMDAMQQRVALEDQLWELQATEGEKLARIREREVSAAAEGNRELVKRIHALQDEKIAAAAADTARQTTDNAMAALQRALDAPRKLAQAQQSAAQELVSTLSSLFQVLKSNVSELYGQVDSTRTGAARRGREFIDQALATARSTGYLPDEAQLADAISAARGGMAADDYATAYEYQRDQLVLAGKLAELQAMSGTQLTAAERQLQAAEAEISRLDGIMATAQDQVDAIRDGTLTIEQALSDLAAAILGEKVTATAAGQAAAGGPSTGELFMSAVDAYGKAHGGDAYYLVKGVNDYDAKRASVEQLAKITGQSTDQVWKTTSGYSEAYWQEVQRQWDAGQHPSISNMPQLDVGTNRVPRDMLAMIHRDEAVLPAAFNPWAGGTGLLGGYRDTSGQQLLQEILGRVATAVQESADIAAGRKPVMVEVD